MTTSENIVYEVPHHGTARKGHLTLDLLQRFLIWLTLASSWFVIIEPSPYEYLFLLTLLIMLPSGLNFHRATIPLLLFLLMFNLGGIFSVMPVTGEQNTVKFMFTSVYMAVSAIFFANLLADDTERRFAMIKNGYIVAAVLGTLTGLIGYFGIAGMGEAWAPIQRAQGTFKDPNVLSTFLIPPAIFLVQDFVIGIKKWRITKTLALLFIISGIFFAFSRGAWASSAGSGILLIILMFVLSPSVNQRARIVLFAVFGFIMLVALLTIALSFENIRSLFLERANLFNSYDAGETGRFGNQLRSIPYLLDRPNGFGPLQFSKTFPEDPHNVYLNAFSSYGWLGGISYLLLVISSIMVMIRTMTIRTPWQPVAIAVSCPLFMTMLQGIQIDTDHWRHFYLMLGMVWGMFAASTRYQSNMARMQDTPVR